MTAYTPTIGDIVRSGPGMTRFTVTAVSGTWATLRYPNSSAVIYRQAAALTLVQAAPDLIIPDYIAIRLTCKQLSAGDVLNYYGKRLTIRMIGATVSVPMTGRVDSQRPMHVTNAAGEWQIISLPTNALTYTVVGGPKWDAVNTGRATVQICGNAAMWRGYKPAA